MATATDFEEIRLPLLGTSHKVELGNGFGIMTGIMYLSPHTESGVNLCPAAIADCWEPCLGHSAGRMVYTTGKAARIRKSLDLVRNRKGFYARLRKDIELQVKRATKKGAVPAVRLNGSSDVAWEQLSHVRALFSEFPEVHFYDYTKRPERMRAYLDGKFPPNYRLTFSRSGRNDSDCVDIMQRGGNVAVVFGKPEQFPARFNPIPDAALWDSAYSAEAPVINGDTHDYRYGDPLGVVVALKAKGGAKKSTKPFVVRWT